MKLKFKIINRELPAFGGFIQGSAIKGKIEILIDIEKTVLACASEDIDFYEFLSETTVHEMLHAFQEMYKKAFDEEQIEEAINQARDFSKECKQ
jgi:ABC-type multidrug transport system ATPase subunit